MGERAGLLRRGGDDLRVRHPSGGERRRNGGLRAGDVGKRERKPFSAGADADEHADGRRLLRHIGKIRFRVRPGKRQLHRRAALNAERGEYTVGLAERKLFAEHDAAVPGTAKAAVVSSSKARIQEMSFFKKRLTSRK